MRACDGIRAVFGGFLLRASAVLPHLEGVDNLVALPLGPHEVVLLPGVEVAHRPPEASLERGSHQNAVVALSNVVLVLAESGSWEWLVPAVRLVNFGQESSVVAFFEFQVLLLVLRIRQVFGELLDLRVQGFQRVVGGFRLLRAEVVSFRRRFECRLQRLNRLGLCLNLIWSISFFYYRFFVHSPLDNEQGSCDETLLEQLGLEHLDKVLDPELLCLLRICCRLLLVIFLWRI